MASIKASLASAVSSASNNKKTAIVGNDTILLYDISSNTVSRNGFNITEKTVKVKNIITDKKPASSTINSKLKSANTHTAVVDDRITHILNITDMLYSTGNINTSHFINTINDISDLGLAILNKIAISEQSNVINRYGVQMYNDISGSLIFNPTLSSWERKDMEILDSIWEKIVHYIPEINDPFPNVINAFIASLN